MMNIEGDKYRTVDNWFDFIPEPVDDVPINYLEIGAYYGANVISYALSHYAKHPSSEIHCIDPWSDYDDYDEYKGQQSTIFETFQRNLATNKVDDRVKYHRGFSRDMIPTFADDFFDIIYIDGNHEPHYIVEDAVLAFRKLKKDGYMIFDDYGWRDAGKGIDAFLSSYAKVIEVIMPNHNTQVFIKKLG
jgi:hypothetical protein